MTSNPKISSYFDEVSYQAERKLFTGEEPSYVGHELMVPRVNDYRVIPQTFDRYALINHQEHNLALISNTCLHRQAKLLEGQGNTKEIVCKLHCWSYSNTGELKNTPHFKNPPKSSLDTLKPYSWNGLLFKNRPPVCDLKSVNLENHINFDNYFYSSTEVENYDFNWKIFAEIYLENYHVFSMHPGLKRFVTPGDLQWHFGEDYSIQKVGIGKNLNHSGTPVYKEWQESVLQAHPEAVPRYGAIWMFLYPNIMLEWYPNVLVVSTILPTGPRSCVNHVEFYYPKEMYEKNSDYFAKEKAAYMETAVEDNAACTLLAKGRFALYQNGAEQSGHLESFLESGVAKFYEYLKEKCIY